MFSEELFDFSAEQMTSSKAQNLKLQFCNEFSEVFRLCLEILEKAQRSSLIKATLEALLKFLKWLPLGYIFETCLINILKSRFLSHKDFKCLTLSCFTEIASLSVNDQYEFHFSKILEYVLESLQDTLPYSASMNLADAFPQCTDEDAQFIRSLIIFFNSIISSHLSSIENSVEFSKISTVNLYILKITAINDVEIFKICLEYWHFIVSNLYNEYPYTASDQLINMIPNSASRRNRYLHILSSLRSVMIEHMVKPEEVLIVEDENGEIIREQVKELDTLVIYKSMREILVYLTNLDCEDTELIMREKLMRQIDGSEWSWANISKLCWAIGSISGAMNEEIEERFLVHVIKDLLGLVEMKRGKDNKAVIASNIMYIVGQYPRFLKSHWKFLKTVVNKLFEFMHESHEGVQDMACDTFIKITSKCKKHFVIIQSGENLPFIEEILLHLPEIIGELQSHQVQLFYESIGNILSAQSDLSIQARCLDMLMLLPNQSWDSIVTAIAKDNSILDQVEVLKSLVNITKTNVSVCRTTGTGFISQLNRIYLDILALYRTISSKISNIISAKGQAVAKTPLVRSLRSCKREFLRLIETFIQKLSDASLFTDEYISHLFESILLDYERNIPEAREAEVLNVTSAIINIFGQRTAIYTRPIFDTIFESTLSMINKDFSEFPDHRLAFFKLMKAFALKTFNCKLFFILALIQLPDNIFKMYINSISWAFKHSYRDISMVGLEVCSIVISQICDTNIETRNHFFKEFFYTIMQDILYVLTDADHKSGICIFNQHRI